MFQRMMAQLADDLQAETEMLNSIPKDEGHIRSKLGQIFNPLTVITWGGKDPYFGARQGDALARSRADAAGSSPPRAVAVRSATASVSVVRAPLAVGARPGDVTSVTDQCLTGLHRTSRC